jgi:hypothetical protein
LTSIKIREGTDRPLAGDARYPTKDAIAEHVAVKECCRGMKSGNGKNRKTKQFMHPSRQTANPGLARSYGREQAEIDRLIPPEGRDQAPYRSRSSWPWPMSISAKAGDHRWLAVSVRSTVGR